MTKLIVAVIVAAFAITAAVSGAAADGAGSPAECEGGPSVGGDTYTAPDGFVVGGVCIKSGQLHSDVITDNEFGCYDIDGLGTQTVEVSKDSDGPDCQDVSHLDIILSTCGAECDPPECDPEVEQCDPPEECDPEVEQCDPPEDPCELEPESCVPIELVCVDGDFVEAPANQATNDCGFFNACINGEVERISEFEADQLDIEEGVCPFENEEDPPETPTEPEPEPVEEVAGVQEVAPTEEVAALPSAGFGSGNDKTSLLWIATLGVVLIGLSAATAAAARPRR